MAVIRTALGDLTTMAVPLESLEVGDHFVGGRTATGHHVYEVTADCRSNPRGWIYVVDLTAPPEVDNTGFFAYSLNTSMAYVIAGLEQDKEVRR